MNDATIALGFYILTLALMVAVIAAALGALLARSLFMMCVCLVAAGAVATAVVLALGAPGAALALAIVATGWAPLLLLGGVLLSARATKGGRDDPPWLSIVVGAAVASAIVWAGADIGASIAAPLAAAPSIGFWIAPLVLVAAGGCVGLLGFGERGVLETLPNRREQ